MPGVHLPRSFALLASGLAPLACGSFDEPTAVQCGSAAVAIGALQGTDDISPRREERATVAGIVTLLAADADPPGFYLQSLLPDDDPLSSEGLFVQTSEEQLLRLARGTAVRLRGRVTELRGVTTLSELELVEPCGAERLALAPIELRDADDAERWESMSVHSAETWTLIDTAELESTGRVLVSASGRSYAPGHPLGYPPNQAPSRHWALLGLAEAVGSWLQGGTLSQHLRLGARADGLSALVRAGSPPVLLATEPVAFRAEPAPAAPRRPADALRVAALNLDNYFAELGARGAGSASELARQRAKLVALLQQLDADILALSEVGNSTASGSSSNGLAELLDALAAATPGQLPYQVSESGPNPEGALRSAIAYRSRQLRATSDAWFASEPTFRRAPLLQRFESESGSFTLAVVHLKSKLCSGAAEIVGPEGCGAEQRREEARALLRVLSAQPAAQAEETLVIGDFNSDVLEAPLRELSAGGLRDLFEGLPAAQRYSYVFEGRAAQLDHALAASALVARLRGAHIWHINADEPALLGYELEHATRAYAPDARRASDHDPIVVDLVR